VIRFRNRNALGDIYFNAGSRLRISSDLGWYKGKWRTGPFVLWIRWGFRAQWQFAIVKRWRRPWWVRGGFMRIEFGWLTLCHYR